MRFGVWLPIWLWLVILPFVLVFWVVYGVVWCIIAGSVAMIDAGDRRRERRTLL